MLVWYLIASLCLVLANGQVGLQNSQSDQQPLSTKNYLLYLTPDQAQGLQSQGAVIRPFQQLEDTFLQQHYQQSFEENIEQQDGNNSSDEDRKLDKDLETIYEALDNQQTNKASEIQSESTERPVEKPRLKYSARQRQQEYIPSKNNKFEKPKYSRYRPRNDDKVLKAKPYSAQQSIGSYFDGVEDDLELPSYFRRTEKISSLTNIPKFEDSVNPNKFQGSENNQESAQLQRYVKIQIPAEIQEQEDIQKFIVNLEHAQKSRLDNKEKTGPVTFKDTVDREEERNEGTSQEQMSLLTENQEKINESTAQKKDLIDNERAIRRKLQKIRKSGSQDVETYILELEKLKQNLGKQNILAEKLASQILSNKPQGLVKEELDLKKRRPEGKVRAPESLLIVTPRPYPISWVSSTPIPVPDFEAEKVELEQPPNDEDDRTILIPRNRNSQSSDRPKNLFIVRTAWER